MTSDLELFRGNKDPLPLSFSRKAVKRIRSDTVRLQWRLTHARTQIATFRFQCNSMRVLNNQQLRFQHSVVALIDER